MRAVPPSRSRTAALFSYWLLLGLRPNRCRLQPLPKIDHGNKSSACIAKTRRRTLDPANRRGVDGAGSAGDFVLEGFGRKRFERHQQSSNHHCRVLENGGTRRSKSGSGQGASGAMRAHGTRVRADVRERGLAHRRFPDRTQLLPAITVVRRESCRRSCPA